ncbi:MAG: putative 2OG-Fe(II) oxygenase [Alphaproteobacteria bacterium]
MKPKPTRLVLFHSSLPHRVFPFSENKKRISIAFDIVPKSEFLLG